MPPLSLYFAILVMWTWSWMRVGDSRVDYLDTFELRFRGCRDGGAAGPGAAVLLSWYLGELCDIFMRASRGLKLAPGREIIGLQHFLAKH